MPRFPSFCRSFSVPPSPPLPRSVGHARARLDAVYWMRWQEKLAGTESRRDKTHEMLDAAAKGVRQEEQHRMDELARRNGVRVRIRVALRARGSCR